MKKLIFLLIPLALIVWAVACKKKDASLPADATCDCSGLYFQYIGGNDTMYAPTVFTPNADGLNDYFHLISPRALTLTNFQMTIYSGANSVFQTSDPSARWDGTISGSKAPSGSYVVRIKFTDDNGNAVNDCTCVTILQYDATGNCYVRPSSSYYYEDQFDPSKGLVRATLQGFCP